jgi:UDP-N-acetylmuramyl tripeptide synthase
MAKPGDVVLLAGKGCETALVTNQGPIEWSDVGVAQKVFAELEDNQIVA